MGSTSAAAGVCRAGRSLTATVLRCAETADGRKLNAYRPDLPCPASLQCYQAQLESLEHCIYSYADSHTVGVWCVGWDADSHTDAAERPDLPCPASLQCYQAQLESLEHCIYSDADSHTDAAEVALELLMGES
ncbi:hypothetical protein J6590_040779 [Homalodisca vitripennis]|nr:hypothetical protein J6590_040779 [Homalodisca vitripennis]